MAWARQIARIWAALGGDPNSPLVLHRLQDGGGSVAQISTDIDLPAADVKRCFSLLSRHKLARAKGMGPHTAYELTDEGSHYAEFVAARAGTV